MSSTQSAADRRVREGAAAITLLRIHYTAPGGCTYTVGGEINVCKELGVCWAC